MENGRVESSFFNFSDQLRLHTAGIGSFSLGDSIWSDPFLSTTSRRPEDRRNVESAGEAAAAAMEIGATSVWKTGLELPQKLAFTNSNFNRYNNNTILGGGNAKNSKDLANNNGVNNYNGEMKNFFVKAIARPAVNNNNSSGILGGAKKSVCNNNETIGKSGRNKKNNNNSSKDCNNNGGNSVDKRFKALPPSEALPRSQTVGGYIFVCNNETMDENLKRQLFGLPPRYRDSVRVITPGLPIFLYNYSTHQLHGIFEAASFGGTNIDPTAWEDKKHPGESRYPAQVRVITRKNFEPLEEDSFRPILHHYDGPKFRLELSVPEALALLDVFAENDA